MGSPGTPSPAPLPAGDHLVQIYESEAGLEAAVGTYLSSTLLHGEAALVVATPEHRAAFLTGLAERGFDVAALRAQGRLLVLDAEETLASFCRPDGELDPAGFASVVGGQLEALRARHGGVGVYGEMVACLWQRGDAPTAVALEHLWNDLGRRQDFRLFCAYSDGCLAGAGTEEQVQAVFDTHSHVLC